MMTLPEAIWKSLTDFITHTSILEYCGVITGLICVWLAAKNNILNWPVAIISVLIYIVIFHDSKLYADMGLQVYFLVMNVYGWYFWTKARNGKVAETPVTQIKSREAIFSIIGVIVFTALIGLLLHKNTDASFPFIDSFCTACSLIAQIFLARKVLENWLIWIFVDIIYVGVYVSKELYPTAIMYAIYIYIAWMGYREWKQSYITQHDQEDCYCGT